MDAIATSEQPSNASDSAFLRVRQPRPFRWDKVVATLIEVDRTGYIPREVGMAADGSPVYLTRPGEVGRWGESPLLPTPPGSEAFADTWRRLGASIEPEEFELVFRQADAGLPHTRGGTPIWASHIWAIGIALAGTGILIGLLFVVARLVMA